MRSGSLLQWQIELSRCLAERDFSDGVLSAIFAAKAYRFGSPRGILSGFQAPPKDPHCNRYAPISTTRPRLLQPSPELMAWSMPSASISNGEQRHFMPCM